MTNLSSLQCFGRLWGQTSLLFNG